MFSENFFWFYPVVPDFCEFFGNVPVIVHMNTIILAKKKLPVKRFVSFSLLFHPWEY